MPLAALPRFGVSAHARMVYTLYFIRFGVSAQARILYALYFMRFGVSAQARQFRHSNATRLVPSCEDRTAA